MISEVTYQCVADNELTVLSTTPNMLFVNVESLPKTLIFTKYEGHHMIERHFIR